MTESRSSHPAAAPTVLVVDDDPRLLMLAVEALEASGFTVQEEGRPRRALEKFVKARPDAVLVDLCMPHVDGYTICERIRNMSGGRYIPIIIMTGLDDVASIDRAYDAGATDFVSKPINYALLSHRLRYAIRASNAFRTAHRGANYDPLTTLHNRTYVQRYLEQATEDSRRAGARLAVLTLDLDRFKQINDAHGHATGDAVLSEVARRLQRVVHTDGGVGRISLAPTGDEDQCELRLVGRLAGDQFVVIVDRIRSAEDAGVLARQLLSALSAPYAQGDAAIFASASVGIATLPENGETADALLHNSDEALRQAKRGGRNTYQFFAPEVHARAMRRQEVELALTKVVQGISHAQEPAHDSAPHELQLHYQPKVALPSRKTVGVEALLRWNSPSLGFVSPMEFIPLAEDTGMILELGAWVLREACLHGKRWLDEIGTPLRIAVNISAQQFQDPSFESLVVATLSETGFPAELLELELTEGVVMQSPKAVAKLVASLRARGVRIALDDFGTGYSSLSYLTQLPIDQLKIDRSFIRELGSEKSDSIVRAILALAKSLSLSVVAEGVETEAHLNFFEPYDQVEIQGYYFAKPMSASDLRTWWDEKASAPESGRAGSPEARATAPSARKLASGH